MSKGRSIPLSELANLHGKPAEIQDRFLRKFVIPRAGKMPSYGLLKSSAAEATDAVGGLLASAGLGLIDDSALLVELMRKAKGDAALVAFNWPSVLALREWRRSELDRAVHRQFADVPLVGGKRVKLVSDVIPVIKGRGYLVSFDPRRSNGLTNSGLFIVQSLMHHLLRDQYPDLADLDLAVLQFPEIAEFLSTEPPVQKRKVVMNCLGDRAPMSWSDLESGIRETLAIFDAAVAAARRSAPGGATGTEGGLPFPPP
jgi:hypothetical protein